jgi:NADH dehydrogenase FAD-containing subunit
MTENTDVVVIGGGYAGVMTANRLTRRDDVTVTLVNPRPTFVERIRLHQLVGGSHDAVVDPCTNWWAGPTTRSSTTARS